MSKRQRRARIAVVEDDDDLRVLVCLWLSARHDVSAFRTGEELLARIDSLAPQLVILDFKLEGLDGLEVAAEIRRGRHGASVPILVLTGMPPDALRDALNAARAAYLSKPVSCERLEGCVDRLIGRAGARVQASET